MAFDLKLKEVGGHTFSESLLSDGVIIDVGCRGFVFSNADEFHGKRVICIDPDPKVFDSISQETFYNLPKMEFMNVAISDKSGDGFMYLNQSCPEGTTLKEFDPDPNHPFTPCKTITMDDLYAITGTNVDVLKLDCEGAEYIILGETFKPIPRMISCEFHAHTVPEMHAKHYPAIKERLEKDYVLFNEVWEKRHGCADNFWDCLYIRRDLIPTE